MESVIIPKEEIPNIRFAENLHIKEVDEQKKLIANLYRAQALGNLEKIKVRIIFYTHEFQRRAVETTVWGVGEDNIMLKHGYCIPIRSIDSIELI